MLEVGMVVYICQNTKKMMKRLVFTKSTLETRARGPNCRDLALKVRRRPN